MPSLMELVERVNKGELIETEQLEVYQESANSAEKFLAHHANAMLDLRRAQQHMMLSLEAIDYSDQKVLNQFVSVSGFLGLTDLRCGPIVKFGSCAISRRDYGLGVEAIQNAVAYDIQHGGAYTNDRANCEFIAQQYDRAAQCIGWANPEPGGWNNKQTKIAYVVSAIVDDDTTGRAIQSLAKNIDQKKFKFQVYSTEAGVRRDRQQFAQNTYVAGSAKRGATTIEAMNKIKSPAYIAPTDADAVTAAKELANQLAKDHVDVVIFDVNQADPIASLVAQWDVARVKVNLARRAPMYMSGINCVTYADQVRFDADKDYWTRRNVDAKFILEGIDLDEPLGAAPQRATYGIPDSAVVLATAGNDLDKTISDEFIDTAINILRAHPQAIYLLVGEANLAAQKRKFESAGVGKRVGYAGRRKDLPGFLRIADLYLAEFPASSGAGVLQAMSVARPVVAMRWGEASDQSQAAVFVGSDATVPGRDTNAYLERVNKLIRETTTRNKLGKSLRQRVEQHFAYNQTARHLEQLCDQLIQQSDSAGITIPRMELDDADDAIAQVA